MSGVGFWELIILLLIGLIVLGPERLPRVANQLGTWIGQARRMTRVMKRQLEEELNLERQPGIRPARLSAPPPAQPQQKPETRKDYDDSYSPAHAPDNVGTGVDADLTGERDPTGDLPQGEGDDAASQASTRDEAGTKEPQ
jgi:sec-independent protein translocase protein TatB